jgi:hypothetical protein
MVGELMQFQARAGKLQLRLTLSVNALYYSLPNLVEFQLGCDVGRRNNCEKVCLYQKILKQSFLFLFVSLSYIKVRTQPQGD